MKLYMEQMVLILSTMDYNLLCYICLILMEMIYQTKYLMVMRLLLGKLHMDLDKILLLLQLLLIRHIRREPIYIENIVLIIIRFISVLKTIHQTKRLLLEMKRIILLKSTIKTLHLVTMIL